MEEPAKDNTQKHVGRFREKLFAREHNCQRLVLELVRMGCSEQELLPLLFAVCSLPAIAPPTLLDLHGMSKTEVRLLAKDMQSVATRLSILRDKPLNPKHALLKGSADVRRDLVRKQVASLWDVLPQIIEEYANCLESVWKLRRQRFKRKTLAHVATLRLLQYIEERTGGPQSERVSNLLNAGFFAAGGTEDRLPAFFNEEALAKLNQRSKKKGP